MNNEFTPISKRKREVFMIEIRKQENERIFMRRRNFYKKKEFKEKQVVQEDMEFFKQLECYLIEDLKNNNKQKIIGGIRDANLYIDKRYKEDYLPIREFLSTNIMEIINIDLSEKSFLCSEIILFECSKYSNKVYRVSK